MVFVRHVWRNPLSNNDNFGSPSGIRTRVTAVRGRHPRPLDDGAVKLPGMGSNHRHAASEAAVLPAELPGIANDRYTTRPVHFLQPPPSSRVAAPVGIGLAVAVRTEHSKVFDAPVIFYAVYVVDLNYQTLTSPLADAASRASIRQISLSQ